MSTLFSSLPEEDAEVDSVILFELEEMAQNTGTLCMLKRTFSGKHQLRHQHLEVDQEGIPHDRIPAPDPTSIDVKEQILGDMNKMTRQNLKHLQETLFTTVGSRPLMRTQLNIT